MAESLVSSNFKVFFIILFETNGLALSCIKTFFGLNFFKNTKDFLEEIWRVLPDFENLISWLWNFNLKEFLIYFDREREAFVRVFFGRLVGRSVCRSVGPVYWGRFSATFIRPGLCEAEAAQPP